MDPAVSSDPESNKIPRTLYHRSLFVTGHGSHMPAAGSPLPAPPQSTPHFPTTSLRQGAGCPSDYYLTSDPESPSLPKHIKCDVANQRF
ncbi:uncharacterized protein CLUP02_05781 [Colletotrichum lupini]|uniref:Uncharacterized protein n=1 Tax=Colletotrichum lupini TaxID=145971 RepID=A0A9Q8SNE7_9PEZI|nr:uncharacterized protein CLUP02_05781 [Colletotrichum lupini]UQC80298.1 hypothetical protein CLUP02_05781 [Colletotrichum lupini]